MNVKCAKVSLRFYVKSKNILLQLLLIFSLCWRITHWPLDTLGDNVQNTFFLSNLRIEYNKLRHYIIQLKEPQYYGLNFHTKQK
jgi:hypothetical protein